MKNLKGKRWGKRSVTIILLPPSKIVPFNKRLKMNLFNQRQNKSKGTLKKVNLIHALFLNFFLFLPEMTLVSEPHPSKGVHDLPPKIWGLLLFYLKTGHKSSNEKGALPVPGKEEHFCHQRLGINSEMDLCRQPYCITHIFC